MHVAVVSEADLPDLLPLMRGYCDLYRAAPSDEAKDNLRAQKLYERIGAKREEWLDYSLDAGSSSTDLPRVEENVVD
jgi:hypothetical protein